MSDLGGMARGEAVSPQGGGSDPPPFLPPPRVDCAAMPSVVSAKFEDLVAIGLKVLISEDPNLDLVAAGVPMEEIERAIETHEPAVVLLNFGTLRAPAEVYQLHEDHPETRIVVLANRPTATECNQMLSFGATACLSKETEARDIVNAIHLASRGMHVLPRSAAAGGSSMLDIQGSDLLTRREAEVLELLQGGATNAEIAHRLSIGIETVRTHARNIFRKLGITSRRELPRLARQEPIVVDAQRRPVG
jgi:DNA-binding NarL/FixJ family response regulator